MRHRIVAAALRDRTTHINRHSGFFLFQHIGFVQVFINLKKAVMPHYIVLCAFAPKKEPSGIDCIVIKERILFLKRTLDRRIKCWVCILCYWEQDVILRTSSLAVLFLHMITARNQHKLHILKNFRELVRCQPFLWFFRVIVITIKRDNRCRNKVFNAAVVVLVLCKHLILSDSLDQFFLIGDLLFVRIQAVRRFAGAIRSV